MTLEPNPAWLQSGGEGAEVTRRAVASLLPAGASTRLSVNGSGGIVRPGDLAVTQHAGGNMSVDIAPGETWVAGTSGPNQGAYYALNAATVNLVVAAADLTNPRIDAVVIRTQDAAYTGATNSITLAILAGTPTGGATLVNLNGAPAIPASTLVLAWVLVPANTTAIVTADIANVAGVIAHPSGRVYAATGSIATSPAVVNTVSVDFVGGAMVASNNGLTVPTTGPYRVSAQIKYASAPGADMALECEIFRNGALVRRGVTVYSQAAADDLSASCSDLIYATAGDYFNLGAFAGTGGSVLEDSASQDNYLSAEFAG